MVARLVKSPSPGPISEPLCQLTPAASNGEETHEAERYAEHLEKGRVESAAPVPGRASAGAVTVVLLAHGAYDITHFSAWAIEHTSWQEDSALGLPTFTTTNTERRDDNG